MARLTLGTAAEQLVLDANGDTTSFPRIVTFEKSVTFENRILGTQGATIPSASTTTLGTDGNVFTISGTTTINLISSNNWTTGSVVTLIFMDSVTVNHGALGDVVNLPLFLAGAGNFSATINDNLTLLYADNGSGTLGWYEISRTVI